MNTEFTAETSFRAATAGDIDALRLFEQAIVGVERANDSTLKVAIAAYEKSGFAKHVIEMRMRLD